MWLLFIFKLGQHGVLTKVLPFGTGPNYVHTYVIRHPAAEYTIQKPDVNLTRLSPTHVRVWPVRQFCSLFKKGETIKPKNLVALSDLEPHTDQGVYTTCAIEYIIIFTLLYPQGVHSYVCVLVSSDVCLALCLC